MKASVWVLGLYLGSIWFYFDYTWGLLGLQWLLSVWASVRPSSSVPPGTQSVASNGRSCDADDAVVAHNGSSASSSWIPRPAAVAGVGPSAASQWAGTPPLDKWVVGRRPSTHL